MSGMDMQGGLYGAKLYDSARKKLVPVFGTPNGKSIAFKNYSFADRILALMEPIGLVRSYGQSESYKRGFGKYIIEVGFTE